MDQSFEAARGDILAALTELARADPRIEALWLQGSLATGQADAFSDIDAYLAVRDANFDAVWGERQALLQRRWPGRRAREVHGLSARTA